MGNQSPRSKSNSPVPRAGSADQDMLKRSDKKLQAMKPLSNAESLNASAMARKTKKISD